MSESLSECVPPNDSQPLVWQHFCINIGCVWMWDTAMRCKRRRRATFAHLDRVVKASPSSPNHSSQPFYDKAEEQAIRTLLSETEEWLEVCLVCRFVASLPTQPLPRPPTADTAAV